MLARVAENIYWLSRYFERAENTVRLINTHSNLLIDLPNVDDHDGWMPIISINGQDDEFLEKFDSANEQRAIHFLLADESNPSSLVNAFHAIQLNLRTCRDIVPKNVYENINSLSRLVIYNTDDSTATTSERQAFLGSVEARLQAIANGLDCNMCHDIGYLIMRMGCYVERADMTSRIIDVQSSRLPSASAIPEISAIREQRWVSVLRSLAANQMFRRHVRHQVNGRDTLAFLLRNTQLPRSYSFCLNQLEQCVKALENPDGIVTLINALQEKLTSTSLASLTEDPVNLHVFLDELQIGMQNISKEISLTYFAAQEGEL